MNKIFNQKIINNFDIFGKQKWYNTFSNDMPPQPSVNKDELYTVVKKRLQEFSNLCEISTKFYINDELADFIADSFNDIYKLDKINQEFKIPTNSPLLIQIQSKNTTLIIKEIFGVPNYHYEVDYFFELDDKKIAINPCGSFLLSKNFFIDALASYPKHLNFNGLHINTYVDLQYDNELLENRMRMIFHTLFIYIAGINLSNEVDFIDIKEQKGLKNVKTPFKKYSLSNFLSKPVHEHKILSIKLNNKSNSDSAIAYKGSKRLHDVRGHWRQLATGKITYIRPHTRGDLTLGKITKDYELGLK